MPGFAAHFGIQYKPGVFKSKVGVQVPGSGVVCIDCQLHCGQICGFTFAGTVRTLLEVTFARPARSLMSWGADLHCGY